MYNCNTPFHRFFMRFLCPVAATAVYAFFSFSAAAQTVPQSALSASTSAQRALDTMSEYRRQQDIKDLRREYEERRKVAPKEETAAKGNIQLDEPLVKLKYLDFDKSMVLPYRFLQNLKKRYEGKTVSLRDIQNIVKTVNKKYAMDGYITSRAYVSPQDISRGRLLVNLFEGREGKLFVSGNSYLKEQYIKTALGLSADEVLNIRRIEKSIFVFNAAGEAKVRALLKPSEKVGYTDIEAVTQEAQRVQINAFTDNAGQKENGYYRGGLFASVRKILPVDYVSDKINAGAIASHGTEAYFLSYDITEPWLNTTWTFGMDWSETEIVEGDLKNLDVNGDFYDYYVSLKKPVFAAENDVANLGASAHVKRSATHISDYRIQDVDTDTAGVFADNLYLFPHGYFYNRLEATHAVRINKGNRNFWHYNYDGELQVGFLDAYAVNLKGHAQYADEDNMPSSEQIQLGGTGSVRGYPEGMLIADKGFAVQTELKREIPLNRWKLSNTEGFVFYDFGRLYSAEDLQYKDNNEKFIQSTGFGVRSEFLKRFSLSLTAAFPLTKHEFNHNRREVRVLFNIQAKLY